MTKTVATGKMMFYEQIADDFDSIVNKYDTVRRLQVVYANMLREDLNGKSLLDAGCGTGWFSMAASARGAIVTSMDVGPDLLDKVRRKCTSSRVVGSILEMPFRDNSFEFVVSSEVIEHVDNPSQALAEIYRVLKPGGTAVITTPNAFWHWTLGIAHAFGLRKYQGLENWSSYNGLRTELESLGFLVQVQRGLHLFPFVINALNPLLRKLDNYHQYYDQFMVNICVKVKKPN